MSRREISPRAGRREGSALGRGDLGTSLVLIFPLFLAYQVGVLFSSTVDGVDFVTRYLLAAVDYNRREYLLVQLGLAVAFLALLVYLRRRRSFRIATVLPMILESSIYALTMGSAIVFVMDSVFRFGPALAISGGSGLGPTGQAVVTAMGAGLYEEVVFRLVLMGGLTALLYWAGLRRWLAFLVALLVSAALFSAAHHIGPLGDPFSLDVFTYRLLAGVVFGLIFYYRSLSHAVYTHFLYDLYVLLIHHH